MTTPPKARIFRLNRDEAPVSTNRTDDAAGEKRNVRVEVQRRAPPPDQDLPFASGADADGFGDRKFGDAAREDDPTRDAEAEPAALRGRRPAPEATGADDADASMAAKIAAVRAENLTARQLRMARRIAAMHELDVDDDFEAVVLLRERGVDPFHRTEVGKILSTQGSKLRTEEKRGSALVPTGNPLPARMPPRGEVGPVRRPPLPPAEEMTEERRAAEISRIQQDIARRRRRKLMMLALRLFLLVLLPSIIAGYYFTKIATPLYSTYSQFLIQQADSSGSTHSSGGMLGSSPLGVNTDSVAVQSYLTSRDAMLRLDRELGFRKAFEDAAIDPVQRLSPDATNEEAYSVYKRNVKIGYDPTEGVLNMEVIAPDPQLSEQFSLALIKYAEGQVDQMTARIRNDQMKGASENYAAAEKQVVDAQQKVLALQEKLGVFDPTAESAVVMGQIAGLEKQVTDKQLELGQLLANPNPNQSRVSGVRGNITRLREMLDATRSKLTQTDGANGSLAAVTGQIKIAESDLQTRQTLLSAAAEQLEGARIEANKQVRYLSLSVAPIAPDKASYPKAFQDTLVAFLIFAGIYLLISLTVSILREQVSS